MQKPSGLGRGLSSLIPAKKIKTGVGDSYRSTPILEDHERVVQLPVHQIGPNPHQPRRQFGEDDLKDLMESIKEHGIIQPIVVSAAGSGYQLIVGERRWRAAKALNLPTVPAIIRDFSEQKKMEVALIENLQRKDLNPLEVAQAYQKLVDQFNLTQDQLAKRVGKSRSGVANTIRILNATPEVKEAILAGKITEGHARTLSGLPPSDQLALLKKILSGNMNVRETEQAGRQIVVQKHIRKLAFDPELQAKIDSLQQALNTKVEIKKSGSTGQIIIRFFSESELNSIIKKFL